MEIVVRVISVRPWFHYPSPPSLNIIQPAGRVPPYDPNNTDMAGWAGETTLDVEYAHTIAPGANILLVETPVSETEGVTGFPQIVTAENYVINHGLGDVISQSFSATEQTFPNKATLESLRGAYENAYAHHVTVLAASGDSGAADVGLDQSTYYTFPTTSWPDSDPLVTGVGGTQLHLDANGQHTAPDNAWNDTYSKATQEYMFGDAGPNPLAGGGGKSIFSGRPWYQNGVAYAVGNSRGVPDVSMSGACNGAVDTYQSFGGQTPGWYPVCGTSEATPLFSGIVALADQVAHHRLGLINPYLYELSAAHAPPGPSPSPSREPYTTSCPAARHLRPSVPPMWPVPITAILMPASRSPDDARRALAPSADATPEAPGPSGPPAGLTLHDNGR